MKLITRKSKKLRMTRWINVLNHHIQFYIKNGSEGKLYLSNTPITHLPDNLKIVNGDLSLSFSNIRSLPDNLTVYGSLSLWGCKHFKTLPKNLTVHGWLNIHATQISSLPQNLFVGSNTAPLSSLYSKYEISKMYKSCL